ncbi:golgin subfamily A member 6-like protein 7 [Macrobrachium nipponense]|uniref:golgin subfamily A member 6-like protein 7 n=1 Tax=Macrobrachium nipponense TaxID=159736 RepID=UPI0030C87E4D
MNKELKEKTESLESQLEANDVLLKKRDEKEREKQNFFQQALVAKEGELEIAIKKKTGVGLKLKQIETSNQKLVSEKEYFEQLIEGYKDAVAQKKKEVDHIQEVLGRIATEAEKDRETLEVIKSENVKLRELATDLQDRNCELEKKLADETQKNFILTDQVQSLELLLGQKESRLVSATEILTAERAKTEIMAAELKNMKNWVSELGAEKAKYKEQLEEKEAEVTKVKKELDNGKITTQTLAGEAQVMKNWVAELEREHQASGKDERGEGNLHLQQRLQEKDKEVETLRKDEEDHQEQMKDKLQNLSKERNSLIEAVEKQSRECHLLIAEKRERRMKLDCIIRRDWIQKDSEMKKLQEECDKLKENWRIQEEKMIREQQRLMERQRRQEEALRDQDKYMLMTLLHGTAQRNFICNTLHCSMELNRSGKMEGKKKTCG